MPVIELRALSALLSYPRQDLRHALPEIDDVIRASPLIAERERRGLFTLIEQLKREDLLVAEERYVETFDRGRATSLNLFEHLHGESRDRGEAMVELMRVYERAGFALAARELPDHLPVVLEYLSCRDLAETRAMLSDCAHLLRRIGEGLIARGSAYSAVLQALLVIAGEARIDAASVPRKVHETLDADWFEQPAFGGEPSGDARSGDLLPVSASRQSPTRTRVWRF
jgi:nitrate reductase molybdenum cofactor assembly chaperone NarJ/NarW